MTKILLCAALAYAIVAMAAILVGDGVLDARTRSTDTMIVAVPTEFVEDALEARTGARWWGDRMGALLIVTRV
jgi:hypothetical protein